MNSLSETKKAITTLLILFAEYIAWKDFGDRGNPCYDPYKFADSQEAYDAALSEMYTTLAMPKGSPEHIQLGSRIASLLDCKYVTYDWVKKVVGRLLSSTDYNELKEMTALSIAVRRGMKQKGLTTIDSIEEALS